MDYFEQVFLLEQAIMWSPYYIYSHTHSEQWTYRLSMQDQTVSETSYHCVAYMELCDAVCLTCAIARLGDVRHSPI
jgi:hypothetical protein